MSTKLPEGPGRRPFKKGALAALIAALASSCAIAGAPAAANPPPASQATR